MSEFFLPTAIDVETTMKPTFQAHQKNAKFVLGGALRGNGMYHEFDSTDTGLVLLTTIRTSDPIVFHNGLFDLLWLRRQFGIEITDRQVWDTQIAHFILSNQKDQYPSLNHVAEFYGLEPKLDIVKTEYWDKGIDTPNIPRHILSDYLRRDCLLTLEVYAKQMQSSTPEQRRLIRQCCWDMLVLAEMKWNGMQYDVEGSMNRSVEERLKIEQLNKKLQDLVPEEVNWASPKQVATVLYGGTLTVDSTEEYLFQYKDPRKPPVMKTRKVQKDILFPRLVEPLKVGGEPSYSVDEGTLKKLKPKGKAKKIIELLKERTNLSKLVGTYLLGIPKIIFETGADEGRVHGSLNQTRVVTGRLSSDKPNMQNTPPSVKEFFVSRYAQFEALKDVWTMKNAD